MQSNNKKPVVVGIGELLWDMLPTGKKAGGAPINFVYHASRLGAEGYAISAVGDDGLGREILEELDNNSIRYLIEKVLIRPERYRLLCRMVSLTILLMNV